MPSRKQDEAQPSTSCTTPASSKRKDRDRVAFCGDSTILDLISIYRYFWNGSSKDRALNGPSDSTQFVRSTHIGVTISLFNSLSSASATSQHVFVHARDINDNSLSIRARSIDVAHNKPVQLVIIIACIILCAMLATTLACFYRMPKSKEEIEEEEKDSRRSSWSPTFVMNNQFSHGNSLADQDGSVSKRNSGIGNLSHNSLDTAPQSDQGCYRGPTYNAMPLPGCRTLSGPPIVPPSASYHPQSHSKPLSNLRHSFVPDDIELAGSGMSRRPSFIDRALNHRADPRDARLPCFQHPDSPLPLPPKERKATGGSILTAISGSFSSSFLGSRENTRSSRAVDSDFEGTIGGRDGEIPMAKRVKGPRARFPCDTSTIAPTPDMRRDSSDPFTPLPQRCRLDVIVMGEATPKSTPGLAGVGTTMATLPSIPVYPAAMGRVRSFADLQRQAVQSEEPNLWREQSSLDNWIQSSKTAGRPPLSRRGTKTSFISANTLPKEKGLVVTQPQFAPTTTLASWLKVDDEGDVKSVMRDYLVESDENIESDGKSQLSSDVEFVTKKVHLWEGPQHRHSDGDQFLQKSCQRQLQRDDKGRALSADAAVSRFAAEPSTWDARQEVLEEQKRQIDRRQAYLLREKRKADRRLIKMQREKVLQKMQLQRQALRQDDDETTIAAESVQIEQEPRMEMMNHFILQVEERDEEEEEEEEKRRREEHNEMQIRLRQSTQQFYAPVLGQGINQKQRVSGGRIKLSKMEISHRAPTRAPSLSPPESPLTSASEGSDQYFAPKKGAFLVQSRRISRGLVAIPMSNRSISHASPFNRQLAVSNQVKMTQYRQTQGMNRCFSENHPLPC